VAVEALAALVHPGQTVERSPYNETALGRIIATNSELSELWDEVESTSWRDQWRSGR
jgi:hypothetical protein